MDQISKLIQRQMKQQILILGCLLVALMGFAQTSETKVEDNLIFDGNELHKSETYSQAEKKYREALAHAPKNTIAQHNLGNTLFDESYYGEAFNAYKSGFHAANNLVIALLVTSAAPISPASMYSIAFCLLAWFDDLVCLGLAFRSQSRSYNSQSARQVQKRQAR